MSELFKKLKDYADSDYLPMHMPGHKRRLGSIGNPFFIDITEIEGFDNLHHAEGILLEEQKKAAVLYGAEETHFLVNGSTGGILAAVSGCTSFGGKILMARNSHKSAYHAAMLRGLQTVYIYPSDPPGYPHFSAEWGINGQILPASVEKALEEEKGIQAVFITSPTYDGVVSDVRSIARIVHAHGIPLIVDEAHGAHFPFSDYFPEDSVSCGADVVIHSVHKTLPALTQSALIHINGSVADRERIRHYLTVYQSSSPSYVLMAGISQCMEWIGSHRQEFDRYAGRLQTCREHLEQMKTLRLVQCPGMDRSKILISVRDTEISGKELQDILLEKYHVELEMACSSYVCALSSVADREEDLRRLTHALLDLDGILKRICGRQKKVYAKDTVIPAIQRCTLLQADGRTREYCKLEKAAGKISGDFVTLYPPGIPILAPGELAEEQILERINRYVREGLEVDGVRNGRILVWKERKDG